MNQHNEYFNAFAQVEIICSEEEGYCGLFGVITKDNKRINIIRFDDKDNIENKVAYRICERILDVISLRVKSKYYGGMIDMRPTIKSILKKYIPEMVNIDKKFSL